MTKNSLIWTVIWLTFMTILCLIFQNGWSLLLLVVWACGV